MCRCGRRYPTVCAETLTRSILLPGHAVTTRVWFSPVERGLDRIIVCVTNLMGDVGPTQYSGDGGLVSDGGTRGGVVAVAGLMPIHPHLTPWLSARRRMPWLRFTVPGANGRPPDPPEVSSRR